MPNENKEGRPSQGGLSWSVPDRKEEKPVRSEQKLFSIKDLPRPTPLASTAAAPASMPMLVATFAVGLLLGVVAGWMWFAGTVPLSQGEGEIEERASVREEKGAEVAAVPVRNDRATPPTFLVRNQSAGQRVAIEAVRVSVPSWVVVYESSNGARGNALGAKLFLPEETSGSVQLLRPTIAGRSYLVGQRRDDGDKMFSMQKDAPIMGSGGEELYASFEAL